MEGIHIAILNLVIKFIHKYEGLKDIQDEYSDQLPKDREAIRIHFAEPEVTDTYTYPAEELDENGLLNFSCDERGLSKDRVETLVKQMRNAGSRKNLIQWMGG